MKATKDSMDRECFWQKDVSTKWCVILSDSVGMMEVPCMAERKDRMPVMLFSFMLVLLVDVPFEKQDAR